MHYTVPVKSYDPYCKYMFPITDILSLLHVSYLSFFGNRDKVNNYFTIFQCQVSRWMPECVDL